MDNLPDKELARDLALFASNDYQIYKQRLEPITLNYARRVVRGNFDKKLAIQGLANNLARDVLVRYWKEYSQWSESSSRPPIMNKATKTVFGEEMFNEIEEAVKDQAKEMKAGKIDLFGRPRAKVVKRKLPKQIRQSRGDISLKQVR